jgi:hypothetical protein
MILESEVRKRLAAVARRALSIADFEEWLGAASWSMHRDSSPEAIDLVSSIHLLLAERDEEMIDEVQLRRELLSLLNNVRESLVFGAAVPLAKPSASKAYWVLPAQRWALPVSA